MLNSRVALLFAVLTASTYLQAADGSNYCIDHEAEKGWRNLLEKYPQDDDLRKLYSLRKILCDQVAAGIITIDDATEDFEAARLSLKEKWSKQNDNPSEAEAPL